MAAFQKNQLLFNLDVPAMPLNLTTRIPKPEAIVIEKFSSCSGPIITAPKSAFQLSAVSEESLSQAVLLARRDLKKQKELNALDKSGKTAAGKKPNKGRTEIIRSQSYNERLKRREKSKTKNNTLLMKEREKGWKARTTTTQTNMYPNHPNISIPGRRMLPEMPVCSMSPPTKDTGPDLTQLSGDARILAEIQKLRSDLEFCLKQIHQILEAAKNDPNAWRPETPVYAEDIEAERKRVQRREQQETLSLRTIYQLTQEVRVLQDEINLTSLTSVRPAKKSSMLSRLVAIHRGTVRALKTFTHHIRDYDLSNGLPRSYYEMGQLLKQLSLASQKLDVTENNQIPDCVQTLLRDYEEINRLSERCIPPKSPPHLCQIIRNNPETKKPSPASRKLMFDTRPNITKQRQKQHVSNKNHMKTQGSVAIERDVTPDRQAALTAGIHALMRATKQQNQQHTKKAPSHFEVSRSSQGVSWEYPLEKPKLQQFKASHRKGLLLPPNLKNESRRIPKTEVMAFAGDTHYAEPTVSSKLKEVPLESRIQHLYGQTRRQSEDAGVGQKRSASVPNSPRSRWDMASPSVCSNPRAGTPRSRSPSPFGHPAVRRDIVRQVQADRQDKLKRKERMKIDKLRQQLEQPEDWIDKLEERIRQRLQPLLDRAQEILDAYRYLRQEEAVHPQSMSDDRTHDIESGTDLLADHLLGDLLKDTMSDISQMEPDRQAECKADVMMNMPSTETMIQRLQEMEEEQQEIRRRWATLVYEEETSTLRPQSRYFEDPLAEWSSTPTPIHVTSQLPDVAPTVLPDSVLERLEGNPADHRAILFTKPTQHVSQNSMQLMQKNSAIYLKPNLPERQGVKISLPQETIESIENHKKQFEQHLKKNSYQAIGRFNPWLIVEEVANEILEDCLTDVTKELDDISSDIVNQIYHGEFNKVPSCESQGQASTPSHTDYHTQESSASKQESRVEQEKDQSNKEVSQSEKTSRREDKTVNSSKCNSPEPTSANYSYEDDFVSTE